MPIAVPTVKPFEEKFRARREKYQEHLALTQRLQEDLRRDAEELSSQEGWDHATLQGAMGWIGDTSSIYRFAKRNSFNEEDSYAALLTATAHRAERALHQPISTIPPYSESSFFYILPLPQCTDRLGRPILVVSIRDVVRGEDGTLDDLKTWLFWALETLRRTLQDYWSQRRWSGKEHGQGGEGCIVIIDAAGAGYKNLEAELTPTLREAFGENFPGLMDAAYIVNTGWLQRRLWGVVKKTLPQGAQQSMILVDQPSELEEVFDLDKLPKSLGGRSDYEFSPDNNPILQYYQEHTLESAEPFRPHLDKKAISRNASHSSMADVFYTANNTPAPSRGASRRQSITEHFPARDVLSMRDSGQGESDQLSVEHGLRPLSEFKLHLSSSRLSQMRRPLGPIDQTQSSRPIPRRLLKPAILDRGGSGSRRPALSLSTSETTRTYSDRLLRHHASGLNNLEFDDPEPQVNATEAIPGVESPDLAVSPGSATSNVISAWSRSINPWYGYPAVLVPDASGRMSIRPKHTRNRKRDLVKTLVFLFLLRLQSWRVALERTFSIYRPTSTTPRPPITAAPDNPTDGILKSAKVGQGQSTGIVKERGWDRDFVWMLIGFLLMRGSWTRIISQPLDTLGLDHIRGYLGLSH